MSIHEFHASLSDENETHLKSLRSLRDADRVLENGDEPFDNWLPWG